MTPVADDVSEERLKLDDEDDYARGRHSHRAGTEDDSWNRGKGGSRSRSRSLTQSYSRSDSYSRSRSRSVTPRSQYTRSRSRSRSESRGRTRSPTPRHRSRSHSRSGSTANRGRAAVGPRRRSPIGSGTAAAGGRSARSLSRSHGRPGGDGSRRLLDSGGARSRRPRSRSPGLRGPAPPRRGSPGLSGPRMRPLPPFDDPRFDPRDDLRFGRMPPPPPGPPGPPWDRPGPPFPGPPPPGFRDRGPPPMMDPRGPPPPFGPPLRGDPRDPFGPLMLFGPPPPGMRRRSPPPPGRLPPPPGRGPERPPPPRVGSITREVTARRIPPPALDRGTQLRVASSIPPPPARTGSGGDGGAADLGPELLELHGAASVPLPEKKRQVRGGRRIQHKKELQRQREEFARQWSGGVGAVSGSNALPLGNGSGLKVSISPGADSGGEYVMVDRPAGSRPSSREVVRNHEQQQQQRSKPRVRSAVIAAAGSPSPDSDDYEQERQTKKSRQQEPDAAPQRYMSSVMMQRQIGLTGSKPLTAEEREKERQRQQQGNNDEEQHGSKEEYQTADSKAKGKARENSRENVKDRTGQADKQELSKGKDKAKEAGGKAAKDGTNRPSKEGSSKVAKESSKAAKDSSKQAKESSRQGKSGSKAAKEGRGTKAAPTGGGPDADAAATAAGPSGIDGLLAKQQEYRGLSEHMKARLGMMPDGSERSLSPASAAAAVAAYEQHVTSDAGDVGMADGAAAGDRWQPGSDDFEDALLYGSASGRAAGAAARSGHEPDMQSHMRSSRQQLAGAAAGSLQPGHSRPAAAAGALADNRANITSNDVNIFDEFAEVWYWMDEGAEVGPKSIRMLRRLVKGLPKDLSAQMHNLTCYTKQSMPDHKLLKHLLRFGSAEAPDPPEH